MYTVFCLPSKLEQFFGSSQFSKCIVLSGRTINLALPWQSSFNCAVTTPRKHVNWANMSPDWSSRELIPQPCKILPRSSLFFFLENVGFSY